MPDVHFGDRNQKNDAAASRQPHPDRHRYQHPTAAIIVKADVDPTRAKVIEEHYPTMCLKGNSTVQDILLELNPKDASIH